MPQHTDHGAARSLLARYHSAMLAKSADALAELYAVDGVHEFPLLSPFFPKRLNGHEEVRKHYGAVWGASPIRILEIRDVATHKTLDPQVLVSEAEFTAEATSMNRTFVLSFVIVMKIENGLIVHLRDYMDALGAAFELDRLPNLVEALKRRPR
jgi:ketosteroid isomerase-like protein